MDKMLSLMMTLAVAYVAICAYMYFSQKGLVFPSDEVEVHTPSSLIDPYELTLDDGTTLRGSMSSDAQEGKPMILIFSGNAQDVRHQVDYFATNFPEYNAVGVNYRGYVESDGIPSEKDIFSDALALHDELLNFLEPSKVIVQGYSLGSGVASYVASQRDIDLLILTVPFDSVVSMAKKQYPWLPVDVLLKHPFDSVENLKGNQTPKAVLTVENDQTVPNWHAKRLKDSLSHLVFEHEFEGVEHGDVLDSEEARDVYGQALSFVR